MFETFRVAVEALERLHLWGASLPPSRKAAGRMNDLSWFACYLAGSELKVLCPGSPCSPGLAATLVASPAPPGADGSVLSSELLDVAEGTFV